jgi:hypothetical protein
MQSQHEVENVVETHERRRGELRDAAREERTVAVIVIPRKAINQEEVLSCDARLLHCLFQQPGCYLSWHNLAPIDY